jgi:hypothetical protein
MTATLEKTGTNAWTLHNGGAGLTDGNGTTANGTAVDLGGAATANIALDLGTNREFRIEGTGTSRVLMDVPQYDFNGTSFRIGASNPIKIEPNGFEQTTAGEALYYNSVTEEVTRGPVYRVIQLAASDETTALTSGTGKITFRMPYPMTLTAVRASLTTAQTSGSILTVDINEAGTTILSTKLTIDNGEKTSTTAAAAPVISDTALADDAEITIDIDQVGDGTAKGLKVTLIGY